MRTGAIIFYEGNAYRISFGVLESAPRDREGNAINDWGPVDFDCLDERDKKNCREVESALRL